MCVKAKQFNFGIVTGITENQLNQHYGIYNNYVTKINEIWNILGSQNDFGVPDHTDSEIRRLKLGESYAINGVKLHELYFENLNSQSKQCTGKILELIKRDYSTYEIFDKRLRDVCMSMRGWAILALEPINNKLHVYGLDTHDHGNVVGMIPLLVIDLYEHAYLIDFGTDRKKYLDTVMQNINWDVVNKRIPC